jgi:hypothetical protein
MNKCCYNLLRCFQENWHFSFWPPDGVRKSSWKYQMHRHIPIFGPHELFKFNPNLNIRFPETRNFVFGGSVKGPSFFKLDRLYWPVTDPWCTKSCKQNKNKSIQHIRRYRSAHTDKWMAFQKTLFYIQGCWESVNYSEFQTSVPFSFHE